MRSTPVIDCEIERYVVDENGDEECSAGRMQLSEETVIKIGAIGGVLNVDGPILDMLDAGLISGEEAALIALGEKPMPGHA